MTARWCYIPNMKALGLVVSDKNFFENCNLRTNFVTPWSTYATNWNGLNNFGRGTPDNGRRRTTDKAWHNSSPWALCAQSAHGELKCQQVEDISLHSPSAQLHSFWKTTCLWHHTRPARFNVCKSLLSLCLFHKVFNLHHNIIIPDFMCACRIVIPSSNPHCVINDIRSSTEQPAN